MLHSKGTIVVTSGQAWVDIDAFACIIAYTELLNLLGQKAIRVVPGACNATLPDAYRALGKYAVQPPEYYSGAVIVDLSNPEFIASFLHVEEVREVFDHHSGFEAFWKDRIQDQAHIEMIGAAATLIWEEIEKAGCIHRIQKNTAKLIAAAIASNTLNFQISITSQRDRDAFHQASQIAGFHAEDCRQYFTACEKEIQDHLTLSLTNDTKTVSIPMFDEPLTIAQLELWDSEPFIKLHEEELKEHLDSFSKLWFVNAPSIGNGYTILYCTNSRLRDTLSPLLCATWEENIGKIPKLMLRKEILNALTTAL